jgi:5,10-methylenetetrahydromethanopterin reductase
MKCSVLLMGQHSPTELNELIDLCEDLGYDTFWYADERFFRECYIGLGMAALRTRRIALGPLVTDPYSRHPAMTAAAIASLAELAPGRVRLGMGAGGSGFFPMGIQAARPLAAVEEAITLIRKLLRGERVTFHGEVVHFSDGWLDFPTVHSIPVYIGSSSRRMLELAGRTADGVCIGSYASDQGLEAALRHIALGAQSAGRSLGELDVFARIDLAIASSRQAAYSAAKPEINYGLWFGYGQFAKKYLDYDPQAEFWHLPQALLDQLALRDWSLVGPSAALVPDAMVPERSLAGTLEDVIANTIRIARHGIDHITIYPLAVPGDPLGGSFASQIRVFACEVLPQVEKVLAAERHSGQMGEREARSL